MGVAGHSDPRKSPYSLKTQNFRWFLNSLAKVFSSTSHDTCAPWSPRASQFILRCNSRWWFQLLNPYMIWAKATLDHLSLCLILWPVESIQVPQQTVPWFRREEADHKLCSVKNTQLWNMPSTFGHAKPTSIGLGSTGTSLSCFPRSLKRSRDLRRREVGK